jgi:hypothetical protein
MCTVLLPPDVNPTAVKYIISYISYHVSYQHYKITSSNQHITTKSRTQSAISIIAKQRLARHNYQNRGHCHVTAQHQRHTTTPLTHPFKQDQLQLCRTDWRREIAVEYSSLLGRCALSTGKQLSGTELPADSSH